MANAPSPSCESMTASDCSIEKRTRVQQTLDFMKGPDERPRTDFSGRDNEQAEAGKCVPPTSRFGPLAGEFIENRRSLVGETVEPRSDATKGGLEFFDATT